MKKEHTRDSLLELLKPYRIHGDKLSRAKKNILLEKVYELNLLIENKDSEPPACDEFTCWIPLRDIDNKIVEWTLIDKSDFDIVNKYSWHLVKKNNNKYANSSIVSKLHILLLGKAPNDMVIDHINHNGLDNTRKNIRFATYSLNSQNVKKKIGTSSIYFGVSKTKWGWRANHSNKNIGHFKEEVDAAYAYDIHIKEKYNGIGKINNIEKPHDYIEYKKKISGLPRGVIKIGKKYRSQYWDISKKTCISLGTYETIDKASKVHEEYCLKDKNRIENKIEKEWQLQSILRNSDGIAVIPVNNKGEEVFAFVDDDLWHHFMRRKWNINSDGYAIASGLKMQYEVITPVKGKVIDHINSKIDNRRASLRINTISGNNHHRVAYGEVKMKGVSIKQNVFSATIQYSKKRYNLGYYKTKEIAGFCYNCAAQHFYGDMASLNDNIDKNEFNDWEWEKNTLRLLKKPQDSL